MKCPKCGSEQNRVSNTRDYADRTMTRRQRKCIGCKHIWYTLEVPELLVRVEKQPWMKEVETR
jgi:transcriptional regulator NrdR family protein